jgi:hypothetical protein
MPRLCQTVGAALLAFALLVGQAEAASGYFVIVSSTALGSDYDYESAEWAAECGYEVSEGRTVRGSGFTPGLYILYVGPFSSQSRANRVRRDLLDCVPDAYVKYGRL